MTPKKSSQCHQMRTRNLGNGVRRAARPSRQIWNFFFSKICPQLPNSSNSRAIAVQTSVGGLVVSLKRTDLFLKTELPASSRLARLCFQTNTHQKLQLCRSVRLCVFLSEKRAKPFLHAEVSTTSLSLAVGIPFSLILPSPLYPLIVVTLTTVRVIYTQNNKNI